MRNNNLKGSIYLFFAALLWGTTFIVQRLATEHVGAFTFVFFRSMIAFIILFFVTIITKNKIKVEEGMKESKVAIFAALAGAMLFFASIFQQIGLETVPASKSGFITSTYMIFVPIIGVLFKEKIKGYIWICVLVALIGSYLLSATSGLSFGFGELITLLGAIFFALQILFIDRSCKYMVPYKFCMIQMGVVAFFSFIMMMVYEKPSLESIKNACLYILYAAVFSSFVAYSLQIIGQNYAEATVGAIVMSLESVIALIAGFVLLNETMTAREIIGSILIFSSVVCSQKPFEKFFKKKDI